jgi:hypothetical protein
MRAPGFDKGARWEIDLVKVSHSVFDTTEVCHAEACATCESKDRTHLSYPVKFSELCESLAPAIEQFPIEVWFSRGWKPPRPNERRENHPVIAASYSPTEEPPWRVGVSPIPRPLRAIVHPHVMDSLAGVVRSWFLADRGQGWYSTYHGVLPLSAPAFPLRTC